MAYSKLPKVIQDYPLGFQDINQAIDNNAALRDLYDAKHGLAEPAPSRLQGQSPWNVAGRHDDVHVARTVARLEVSTSSISGLVQGVFDVSGPAIAQAQRIGTGQWQFDIANLSTWWALVNTEGQTTTPSRINCYRYQPSSGVHQLFVTTFLLSAGVFVATDMSMIVSIFGNDY